MLQPQTPQDVAEMVQAHSRLLPFGGQTKPALSMPAADTTALVDMRHLRGLIEYEPDEYTFTAYAGTPIAEIAAELAHHGQYLPFDPLFTRQGATLGGTVAANAAGSGRFRYGGVRDFILGVRFVDGYGRLVRGGGKVVKNAAGFDLPKFMVGSLGRYGILTEVTFKVFPKPRATCTLQLIYASLAAALQATFTLANQPFELEALDLLPQANGQAALWLRLGGLPEALPPRTERLRHFLQTQTTVAATAVVLADAELWAEVNSLTWAGPTDPLVKIPIAPKQLLAVDGLAGLISRTYTAAGNVAWLTVDDLNQLDQQLRQLGLVGLVLRGAGKRPFVGQMQGLALVQRVKQALDPHGKFLALP